jgi:acyl-CoA thioesterase FadM
VRQSLLHFGYEVVRAVDNMVLATGETTHIIVNDKFERCALPEKYLKAFKQNS